MFVALQFFVAGLIAHKTLPIEFVPDISPSQIQIVANYPGDNASIIEKSVTDKLEDLLFDAPGVDI